MEIKVKASFKSINLDLAIEILDWDILSGLDRGNGAGDKGLGGLAGGLLGGDKSDLLNPWDSSKGFTKGLILAHPAQLGTNEASKLPCTYLCLKLVICQKMSTQIKCFKKSIILFYFSKISCVTQIKCLGNKQM